MTAAKSARVIQQHHLRALLVQQPRDSQPDALRGTSHDRRPTLDQSHPKFRPMLSATQAGPVKVLISAPLLPVN